MAIIKVKEIIGTSPNSFEDALQNAINHACEEKQNVTGAKIVGQAVAIEDGRIVEYKVNVKIAYRWEKELHQ
ncbi:MAG: dodecin family protein [Candidatus Pacebacteria bacterium]|nr:dodecin family protein [Candidatus Paceibacterota bacterium]